MFSMWMKQDISGLAYDAYHYIAHFVLAVLSWLVLVFLMGVTPFCGTFIFLHVCVCCLNAKFLFHSHCAEEGKASSNDKKYCHRNCDSVE